ncbi:MAG TPA: PAS domain-containing protein, partial [Micromonosporaceae bacterium]|nr:PAS domain-containing protein [Micromonosporaceae bacterium]
MGATLVVYLVLPATRTAMLVVMGLLGAAAIACGCVEQRPPRAGAWALFAVAIVLLAASEVGFDMVAKRPTRPHPSGADLIFIAAYLPLAVALLWLGHPRAAGRRWPAAVDAAILSLGCTLVVWILLIRPTVIDLDLSGIGKITAIGSWVGTVTVFAAAVLLLVTWRSNIAAVLLGCAIAALMVTDLLYGAGLRDDVWHTSEPLDLGVFACCVLLGTAALVSAMTRVASIPIAADQLSVVRLVVLATALLIAPTALFVEATNGSIHNGIAIATISVALSVLLLVRGALAVRMLRRRGLADRAAADAARTLDFATDVDSVRTALNEALAKILDGHGNGSVVLDVAGSRALPSIPRGDSDVTPQTAALRIPLATTDGTDTGGPRPEVRFYGPRAELVDLSDVFSILAGQAATALHRIELANLRLDEEKQQYFRTLVLNSTDVILICRNGTVAYASPSAMTMFGRDVVGEPCADLVTPRPSSGLREHAFIADTQEEGSVVTPDGVAAVVIHRRDLTDDPTVAGHVLTIRDVTTQLRLQRELAFRASH